MPPLLRRLAASGAVLLSLLIVGVLALRVMGVQLAVGPLASATPVAASVLPAPSGPGAVGTPASGSPQVVFAGIERQVAALRGLPMAKIGPPDILTRQQLTDELKRQFERDYPPARQAADNATLRALGLLGPSQDVAALQLRLLSSQVIGFYDDRTKRMAVVTDAGLTPEAEVTYAHEYTHALQDASFGLASLKLDATGEDDRSLAHLALVEGDATTAMILWALGHLTREEQLGLSQTPAPDTAGIPAWMVQQLEFPYTAGAQFVSQLYAKGGFAAVDAAFRNPPASTEQVLHYDKYVAGEAPVAVAVPDPSAALGGGWREVASSPAGEEMIRLFLEQLGVSSSAAVDAAAGWGGDRLVTLSGPGGSSALVWRLAWDAPADATQFAAAYAQARAKLPFPSRLVALSSSEQLVVHASSPALLDQVVAAARR